MSRPRPLFLTGLPRSGTNLLTRSLMASDQVMVAIHAFQPLFKSLRNAMVRSTGESDLLPMAMVSRPFQDGYFNDLELRALDVIHAAAADVPFDGQEWSDLLARLRGRAADEAADLCDAMAELESAKSYRAMLDRALHVVATQRQAAASAWVGLIDTWIVSFLPWLARQYADARFIVIQRDPRAIASSILGYLPVDPTQCGHVLSVLRQWRKEATMLFQFRKQPELKGRLKVVRYEDLVRDTEGVARDLCRFLEIEYRSTMIDASRFTDAVTGRTWGGNSTFASRLDAVSAGPVARWQSKLDPSATACVEFVCGADMRESGYEPTHADERLSDSGQPLEFLIRDGNRVCSWRNDSGDPHREYGLEAHRRALLKVPADIVLADAVRRAYLSEDYFAHLRSVGRVVSQRAAR